LPITIDLKGFILQYKYIPLTTLTDRRESTLDKLQAMDQFLRSIERHAYSIAMMAIGNREEALDIIQDAMFKLVQLYIDKPEQEWRCLFYKILQNQIRDRYRRNKVRNYWRVCLDKLGINNNDDEEPLERFADQNIQEPSQYLSTKRNIENIAQAINHLPLRQQQAFLLRAWEGLSEAETAIAMGCSKGSVKTHYSRAREALRSTLNEG